MPLEHDLNQCPTFSYRVFLGTQDWLICEFNNCIHKNYLDLNRDVKEQPQSQLNFFQSASQLFCFLASDVNPN